MGEDEKKRKTGDPFSGITGGLIIILLGVVFLLTTLDTISWADWWAYFLFGLGVILILDGLIRISSPARHPSTGKFIGGSILIIIGASHIFGFVTWWPLILIAVGVILVVSSLRKVVRRG